ncbi:MAG: TetR/AcrR family transcriptional regulator [Gammaproteobacteria bacterium]|nr:TetR/AcrR family transcriptional regulator [Gammaproteobacteria bacterium]
MVIKTTRSNEAMGAKGEANRQHIVDVADNLFYQKGYNQTSFTDIAEASEIPRGNFYYYFKTKDEILLAVIEHRTGMMKSMLETWDKEYNTPLERLKRFAHILRVEEKDACQYGCPLGSLTIELGKAQQELQAQAKGMFDVFKTWLIKQFSELGYSDKADYLAMQLMSRIQGIVVMAHAYNDPEFINISTDDVDSWIDELGRNIA